MATVTGYTAERMQAIENAAIIDGDVVGDDLILTRYDTTTINAGNVRGPQGIQGPVGEVTDAELAAAVAGLQTQINALPKGFIAQSLVTANQLGITAITNLTGLTATWTAVANRRYLLELQAHYEVTGGANTGGRQSITTSGNAVLRSTHFHLLNGSGAPINAYTAVIVTPSAGSVTYKGRAFSAVAMSMIADSTDYLASFRVTDIGPS